MDSILINHQYILKEKEMAIFLKKLDETPKEIKYFLHEKNILTIKYKSGTQYKLYTYWK